MLFHELSREEVGLFSIWRKSYERYSYREGFTFRKQSTFEVKEPLDLVQNGLGQKSP